MTPSETDSTQPAPDPMNDYAAQNDLVNIARLLDEGWSINQKFNKYGWTLLEFAAFSRNKELAALLLERGARVGKSLDFAIKRRSQELIDLIKPYADREPVLPLDPRDPKVFTKRHNDAWRILMEGDVEQGLRLFTDLVKDEGTGRHLGSLGFANLLAGNYREAVDNNRELRQYGHPFSSNVGAALWMCGEHGAACEDWAQQIRSANSSDEMYEQSAGALQQSALLWWASARPDHRSYRHIAVKQLSALARTDMRFQNGLGPVVHYLLGEIGEKELLEAAVDSKYDAVESLQFCQYHFYIAAAHLGNSDVEAYRRELANVLVYVPKIYPIEKHLARYELGSL